jgi:hypothetical protein
MLNFIKMHPRKRNRNISFLNNLFNLVTLRDCLFNIAQL